MITLNVTNNKNNATVRSFLGLSRDTKPIKWFQDKAIPNGSLFYEIDTARNYMYSADDETWYYQPSNGGGVTFCTWPQNSDSSWISMEINSSSRSMNFQRNVLPPIKTAI